DPRDRFQSMDELRAAPIAYLSAIGQDEGLETGRLARVGGRVVPTDSGRQREVATRGDIDGYERRLRRRSMMSKAIAVLALSVMLAAGAWGWVHRPVPSASVESEPNDEITQADPLEEGQPM